MRRSTSFSLLRRVPALGAAVVLAFATFLVGGCKESGSRQSVVTISLPPLPPPPPPPPPPPQQAPPPMEAPKMVELAPVPDEPPPDQPPDSPAADLGTNLEGSGPPDGFGMVKGSGGRFGSGTGRGPGNPHARYLAGVQNSIRQALMNNKKVRTSRIENLQVRIYVDPSTGRLTRASLAASTGNPELDAELSKNALPGLPLEPLPPGLSGPLVLRINAKRPN